MKRLSRIARIAGRARAAGTRDESLDPQHPAELPLVGVVELGVAGGGLLAALAGPRRPAQLAAQRDPEVERRPDPLGAERQAVAGRVAGEEDAALGRAAQLVGDPVALVADPVPCPGPRPAARSCRGRGSGGRRSRCRSAARPRPGRTSRSRRARSGGRSRSPGPRRCPRGGPPARARAARRAAGSRRREASTRRQPSASTTSGARDDAAVGLDRDRAVAVGRRGAPVHLGGLEARVALAPEQLAELAVVEGREGPGEAVAGVAVGGVHQQRVEALALGVHQAQSPAATRSGCRRRRSGARRSRSGRRPSPRPPSRPAPAPPRARRSSPRRSARRTSRRAESALHRVSSPGPACGRGYPCLHYSPPCPRTDTLTAPATERRARHSRRGVQRPAAADQRPRRPQLRGDDGLLRRGRRRQRQGGADRQGRGPGRHRLQVGGRHPLQRALDPQVGRPGAKRSSWARRSTPSSSPRRTPRGA